MSRHGRAPFPDAPSESSSDEDLQGFLDTLTRAQTISINEAFDEASKTSRGRPAKRQRKEAKVQIKGMAARNQVHQAAGGFILEDDDANDDSGGGGFLPEEPKAAKGQSQYIFGGDSTDDGEQEKKPSVILLDRIPDVLDSLGFDNDDPAILSTFEHAAQEDDEGNQIVRRKDFLKVAAILMTQQENEKPVKSTKVRSGGGKRRAIKLDVNEDMDEHDDSDPLVLSSDEGDEEDPENEESDPWADEDDMEGALAQGRSTSPPSKRRTTRSIAESKKLALLDLSKQPGSGRVSPSTTKGKGRSKETNGKETKLSSSQKDECIRMFQQFFASADQSSNQSISMAEIRYVATLLNEKLSDADVSQNSRLLYPVTDLLISVYSRLLKC